MKFMGLEIKRIGQALNAVPTSRGGWRTIRESFTGAWQQNVEVSQQDLICYPTLYACLMRISTDIGKLPFCLKALDSNYIWQRTENNAYSPVLRKPNGYQTAQQFREQWMLSKMSQGNTYALKRRDNRGVVNALYVLDPNRVQPYVTNSGAVYYRLFIDPLNTLPIDSLPEMLFVPATEIIHDRCMTIHHPLVGVPPLCAAYWPAVKNLNILQSSAKFFGNSSQPGGILTGPAGMCEEDAEAVKKFWDDNFTGENAGKVAVIGADMKFTSFAMKSADSQLIEQMRYSDEQICQPFGIPPFKIGIGSIPAGLSVDAINLMYYDGALSGHIEAIENLIDEGLSIPANLGIWMDLEPLLRMDLGKQAEVESALVSGKIKTPDEARARFNLSPTGGGDTLWGQHQDYPLGILAQRTDVQANTPNAIIPDPQAPQGQRDMTATAMAILWKKSPESFSHA